VIHNDTGSTKYQNDSGYQKQEELGGGEERYIQDFGRET
jgi:hypothetical protein